MQRAKPPAVAIAGSQTVDDVVRRLRLVHRFDALTGPHATLAIETQRDFVFGIMSADQAGACTALYEFVLGGADRATSLPAEDERAAPNNPVGPL